MAGINSANISFSGLKSSYVAGNSNNASQNSKLRDGETNTAISLSFFRNANFTDNETVPGGSNSLSINSHFRGKTFGIASSLPDTGVYENTSTLNGSSSTVQRAITIDLSSSSFVGQSVDGMTGRLFFKYTSGNHWASDFQITRITVNGKKYKFGGVGQSPAWSSTYSVEDLENIYTTSIYQWNTSYNNVSNYSTAPYTTLSTGTTGGRWNARGQSSSENTPSSNTYTGKFATNYVYYEASGSTGYSYKTAILKSPPIDFTSDTVIIHYYAFGTYNGISRIGTLKAGVELTEETPSAPAPEPSGGGGGPS